VVAAAARFKGNGIILLQEGSESGYSGWIHGKGILADYFAVIIKNDSRKLTLGEINADVPHGVPPCTNIFEGGMTNR